MEEHWGNDRYSGCIFVYDKVVEITRKYTQKPLIFDGQKWGTDIPDTARSILTPLNESGIDVVIIFKENGKIKQIPISEMMPYPWPKRSFQKKLEKIKDEKFKKRGEMNV